MLELVHERLLVLEDSDGRLYDRIRVYAEPQRGGTWRGIIAFLPSDGREPVETSQETTQSNIEGVAYWATGLEPIYFEGALRRALHRHAGSTVAPVGRTLTTAGTVQFVVESLDAEVPLRLMGSRTLVPGQQRRIHNGGVLMYQGTSRTGAGAYEFIAQFASENAAALLANTLWSELHGTGAVLKVEGAEVVMRNAAIKDALTGALVR